MTIDIEEQVAFSKAKQGQAATPSVEKPWYPDESGEWVEWGGGDCPVDPSDKVYVLLPREREGRKYFRHAASAELWLWQGAPMHGDEIVAYKLA